MSADDVYAANHQPSPVGAIVRMLEQMQQADVDFAVMVCNTAHIYFDEIRSRSPIKLLHIIENAALRSQDAGAGRAGLLATTPTVASGIYQRYFSSTGRQLCCPDPVHQQRVMDAIFHPGYGLKATNTTISDLALDDLRAAAEQLRKTDGVETLVLGCTELSMAIPGDTWHGFRIIDPVRLLAQASLEHAGYATARP
jgi:aspartate racemase